MLHQSPCQPRMSNTYFVSLKSWRGFLKDNRRDRECDSIQSIYSTRISIHPLSPGTSECVPSSRPGSRCHWLRGPRTEERWSVPDRNLLKRKDCGHRSIWCDGPNRCDSRFSWFPQFRFLQEIFFFIRKRFQNLSINNL